MPKKIINLGNQAQKNVHEPVDLGKNHNIYSEDADPYNSSTIKNEWLEDKLNKKINIGSAAQCDPMQTGSIINSTDNPNRNVVYRYSKAIRSCDEAIRDLFSNVMLLDNDGKAWPVPIIFAPQEKAVMAMVSQNVRKDNALAVGRIKLPMMAYQNTGIAQNLEKYIYSAAVYYPRGDDGKPNFTTSEKYEKDTIFGVTRGIPVKISYRLSVWTMFIEDMDQIIEQIILKFNPQAYIKVRGVFWESIVKLDSLSSSIDAEPGDQKIGVKKYQIDMTAETFIPQPIVRRKAVLKTKIDIYNDTNEENITEVIARIEDSVDELKEDNE